ncbi:MAG: nuclear transport factor 2 family protein, partial [Gaiellaceae bacterium]
AVEAGDEAAALATLSPAVVFHSPAVHRPYEGREAVAGLLHVVAETFEKFRYVSEWRDGPTTILLFEANVGNRDLQGVDILASGADGLIAEFTVMVRPLSGLQALAAAVAARLGVA